MNQPFDGLKKIFYAGVGTVAVTAEKTKEVLEDMIEKGELTVEQGKALNKELKHNLKKSVKDNLNVSVKANTPEELNDLLEKMSPEQIALLKEQISKLESDVQPVQAQSEDGEMDEER